MLERSESLINSSKVIRKETITTAILQDAWKAWTTIEGVTSFLVPKATIEPVVGGRYELFSNWNWDLVLGRFQYRFSVGPIDWNNPYIPHGINARPERKLRDHISS